MSSKPSFPAKVCTLTSVIFGGASLVWIDNPDPKTMFTIYLFATCVWYCGIYRAYKRKEEMLLFQEQIDEEFDCDIEQSPTLPNYTITSVNDYKDPPHYSTIDPELNSHGVIPENITTTND